MSTNPFRRSSLKGPGDNSKSNSSPARALGASDLDGRSSPLTLNTRAPVATQKHVNFASPPAVPISPVSYPPSSPESLRISPAFTAAQPVPSISADYSEALQTDPFHAEAETDEDDRAIHQALQNAKANIERVARDPQQEKDEAVRRTLSKFAGAPRKPLASQNSVSTTSNTNRQTMDVDAFTRMLMTGHNRPDDLAPGNDTLATSTLLTTSSESSSSEESLSLSTERVSEPSKLGTERPTGSITESDISKPNASEALIGSLDQNKKKPPPPKSRHGRAITSNQSAISAIEPDKGEDIHRSSDIIVSTDMDQVNTTKKAPPPPLSRRKSQNNRNNLRGVQPPSSTAREGVPASAASDNNNTSKAPPPPPTRRPLSMLVRHTPSDLPTTAEESDLSDRSETPEARSFTPTTKVQASAKRTSVSNLAAPPLPPPRRARGSSRSSIDSQRPSVAALSGNVGSTRSSGEYVRSELDGTDAKSISNANDILADLAALQQEVDAARRSATK